MMRIKTLKEEFTKKLSKSMSKNAIKLAVAFSVRQEGYANIQFDKSLEFGSQKMRIHVLAKDAIGLKVAVYCVNRERELNPNELMDIVTAIQHEVGDDGDVAIAIPINLLDKAKDIFGLTPRVFLVDYDMRVWTYSHAGGVTQMLKPDWLGADEPDAFVESEDKSELPNGARLHSLQYIV
ncbi:MAG: hypothetical protein QXN87_05475 [Candidatus Bathyarchaeia archaeon]